MTPLKYSAPDLAKLAERLRGLAADKMVAAKAAVALAKYDEDPENALGGAEGLLTDANILSCAADVLGDISDSISSSISDSISTTMKGDLS
ncbi:MAG: hypothetical protein ABJJ37_05765 [Roseibium sp.]